jgi:4-amino-4-deoxy-L-arabinose transferase-like glycosyltransferase
MARLGLERWMLVLGGILLLALLLRLWGIEYGLPFAYQIDEERLYVRNAVQMLSAGSVDPNYFQNPPLYSYLIEALFAVTHGGSEAQRLIGDVPDRGSLYLAARILTAVIGTLAVWLTYLVGRRFFDRRTGLLAALLMAVSFLPVFYSHVALDNVPAMAAACAALIGVAGVLQRGLTRDYAVAGAALGVAAATKYIDGIVLLPLLTATVLAPTSGYASRRSRGIAVAVAAAAVAFVVCNPLSVIEPAHFLRGIDAQGGIVDVHKFGQDPNGGLHYYLWTFTWGLGWVPAIAALIGAALLWRDDRRAALVLLPVVPLFLLYMGLQSRYFGRWMLPVFPIVCVLAAYAGARLVALAARRRPPLRPALTAVAALALAGQGLVYVVHNDRVLSRPQTQNIARTWMLEHIPRDAQIVVEPFRAPSWQSPWPRSVNNFAKVLGDEEARYAEYLSAELVHDYQSLGFCWVMASSNYWGPALEDPEHLPGAAGYFRALERDGTVVFSASPYGDVDSPGGPGRDPVGFNYDWAYDFYPMAYERPGPMVLIYRLHRSRCAPPV